MIFFAVAGIVVIAAVLVLLLSQKTRDEALGICNFAVEQSVSKQRNKQKILELLKITNELTNEKIKEELGVTDRSVVRYMDELEKAGKVAQQGTTGRSVTYRASGS